MADHPLSVGAAALAYLEQGYSVIPIAVNSKRPLIKWEEYQQRRATQAEIEAWFGKWPDANIAIVTGKISGLSIIDVDGEKGMLSIQENHINPPTTRVIKTPRGWHLYFAYRADLHTGANFLPGIDVRSDGGYVLAPPSAIDALPYYVFRDNPVAVLSLPPSAFYTRSRNGHTPQAIPQDHPNWVSDALANGSMLGERNQTATRLIGYFHSKGIPRDVILHLMKQYAERCQPPMSERELLTTIDSVTRYQVHVEQNHIVDPPDFEMHAGAFTYTWRNHGVSITIENIEKERDGTKGEITVQRVAPGTPALYHGPANFNLTSTTAMGTLARHLATRHPIDWASILENAARLALAEYRTGDPVVDLRDYQRPPEEKWLINPFIPDGMPMVLFGDGGVGKSLLALAMMLTLQTGESRIMGLRPTRPVQCLYLDWEGTNWENGERMAAVLAGANIDPSTVQVLYRRCDAPLSEIVHQLRRVVADAHIELVVIDSIIPAAGTDSNEHDTVRRFYAGVRQLGVAALCIAHVIKNGEQEKPIGSGMWHNLARVTWEVKKQQEPGEDVLHIGLYNRKANIGRPQKPYAFTMTFAENGIIQFRRKDITDVPTLARVRGVSMPARALALIKQYGPMTTAELARELGEDERSLSTQLSKAKHQLRSVRDRWEITPVTDGNNGNYHR